MRSWKAPAIPTLKPDFARVKVFDTKYREVIPVGPATGQAGLYVCGITPYDATHLGHAFTYLTFDILNRAWRDAGLSVKYIQNVTDVDDPLLERAEQTNVDWRELARDQIDLFRSDMEALRVLPPDEYVPATAVIPEVVDMVTELRADGWIYQIDDAKYPDWYFRSSKIDGFGQVGNLDKDSMIASFAEHGGDPERLEKKDPLDALVWRLARPGEPAWDSALGKGRPGWHIECTATALNRLGFNFSVQGGGRDLVFPHHEMCNAQSLGLGHAFAQAYVHVGMVGLDGEKMSKTKGNLEMVSRLMARGHNPMVIRLALLNHPFDQDWEWSLHDLEQAQRRMDAWRAAFAARSGAPADPVISQLRRAVRNNLNTPQAMRVVDDWTASTLADGGSDSQAPSQIADAVDAILGVRFS